MPASFTDDVMDGFLDKIVEATILFVNADQESSYNDADTNQLAEVALAGGDFTVANDVSGRKVTRAAKNGVPVVADGTAAWLHYGISGSTTLIGSVPLASGVAVTNGGTVDIGAHKFNIQDPT